MERRGKEREIEMVEVEEDGPTYLREKKVLFLPALDSPWYHFWTKGKDASSQNHCKTIGETVENEGFLPLTLATTATATNGQPLLLSLSFHILLFFSSLSRVRKLTEGERLFSEKPNLVCLNTPSRRWDKRAVFHFPRKSKAGVGERARARTESGCGVRESPHGAVCIPV